MRLKRADVTLRALLMAGHDSQSRVAPIRSDEMCARLLPPLRSFLQQRSLASIFSGGRYQEPNATSSAIPGPPPPLSVANHPAEATSLMNLRVGVWRSRQFFCALV